MNERKRQELLAEGLEPPEQLVNPPVKVEVDSEGRYFVDIMRRPATQKIPDSRVTKIVFSEEDGITATSVLKKVVDGKLVFELDRPFIDIQDARKLHMVAEIALRWWGDVNTPKLYRYEPRPIK